MASFFCKFYSNEFFSHLLFYKICSFPVGNISDFAIPGMELNQIHLFIRE